MSKEVGALKHLILVFLLGGGGLEALQLILLVPPQLTNGQYHIHVGRTVTWEKNYANQTVILKQSFRSIK